MFKFPVRTKWAQNIFGSVKCFTCQLKKKNEASETKRNLLFILYHHT